MNSKAAELRGRTYRFALAVVKFCRTLPRTVEGQEMGRQLLKAGTSVAANYRAVCRSRSRPEFVAKLGTVVEEADESVFWLQLIRDAGIAGTGPVESLLSEAQELLAIFVTGRQTARSGGQKPGANPSILKSVNP